MSIETAKIQAEKPLNQGLILRRKKALMRKYALLQRMNTGRAGKVEICGTRAGTTGDRTVLPIGNFEDPEYLDMLEGMMDHENGHCKHTDFGVWFDIKNKLVRQLTNIFEDIRIENLVAHEYPGAKTNLFRLVEVAIKRGLFTQPTAEDGLVALVQKYLLYCGRYYHLHQHSLRDFAHEAEFLLSRALPNAYPKIEAILHSAGSALSTADARLHAEEVLKVLQDEQQEQQDKLDQQEQGDSSDQGEDSQENDEENSEDNQQSDSGNSQSDDNKQNEGDQDQNGCDSKEDSSDQDGDQGDSNDAQGDDSEEGDDNQSGDSNADSDDEGKDSDDETDGDQNGGSDGDSDHEGGESEGQSNGDQDDDQKGDSNDVEKDDSKGGQQGKPEQSDSDHSDNSEQSEGYSLEAGIEELEQAINASDEDLMDDMHEAIRRMMEEKAEEHLEGFQAEFDNPHAAPTMPFLCRKFDGAHGLPSWVPQARQLAQRVKTVLHSIMYDRNRVKRHYDNSGSDICANSLWGVKAGNSRIFKTETISRAPNSAFSILVDRSGSMHGNEMEMANVAAFAIAQALEFLKGAECEVMYYPFRDSDGSFNHVAKAFGERMSTAMTRSFNVIAGGGTPTAEALQGAAASLGLRREEKKILFLITDGDTCGANVLAALRECDIMGITVIGIGIGTGHLAGFEHRPHLSINSSSELANSLFAYLKEHYRG